MSDVVDAKSKILDVAEELFGEEGLDRVSIRNITDKAKVNLAAINYHFGCKEDLIAAVFERRVVPVNNARLAALDVAERNAGKKRSKTRSDPGSIHSPYIAMFLGCAQGRNGFFKIIWPLSFRTEPRSGGVVEKTI